MYKMVVFDIDGTLIPYQENELDNEIKNMFKRLKENNIVVTLATGRDFVTIGKIYQDENIDYFIGANGSFIYDNKAKKYLFNSAINFDDFEKYYNDVLINNQGSINNVILSDDKHAFVWNYEQLDGHWFWEPFKSKFRDFETARKNIDLEQFHLITINCVSHTHLIEKSIKYFKENFENNNLRVQAWWKNGFFVANKDITKASSIEKLTNILNIEMKNVIAFGDGENDIQMLKEVGLGVAMDNASDIAKEAADDTTSSVNDHGTVVYLEKIGII